MYSAESVPEFNPPLVADFEFSDHRSFKNFLLTKCVCGCVCVCVVSVCVEYNGAQFVHYFVLTFHVL